MSLDDIAPRELAIYKQLMRDYSELCSEIETHRDSISPSEWATMVGAKAQVLLALSQVYSDILAKFKRDPEVKRMVNDEMFADYGRRSEIQD